MKIKKTNVIKIKPVLVKPGSDSSSEMSIDNNSEQESNSFIIQKRKKNKKVTSKATHFIETSPNNRFSRQEEKKYSDKHLVAYVGIDHDRGCDVIWNVINISSLNEEQQEILYEEFWNMKNLKHENINTISEVWLKDNHSLIFITDSFFGGSIRQYLYKIGIQKLKVIKSWLKMILLGLDYLHRNGAVYRDLNCGRIYYNNNNGVVSIGDLFVASPVFYEFFNEKEYEIFPPNCMSPEIILNKEISEKADIYSLGMVLIEMITIEIPYTEFNLSRHGIIQKIKEGSKPSLIDRISDESAKQFIFKLIDPDPNKRPTIAELLNDEFLKINDKEDNRKIKLIKIRKRKKKRDFENILDEINIIEDNYSKIKERVSKKNIVPFKRDFEENPYYDESLKNVNLGESGWDEKGNFLNFPKDKMRKMTLSKSGEKNRNNKNNILKDDFKQIESAQINIIATSSHEGATLSKCYSDVYHTANTDYFNQNLKNKKVDLNKNPISKLNSNSNVNNQIVPKTITDESTDKLKKSEHIEKGNTNSNIENDHTPPYQIFDTNYNVHLKFLISQDGKLHEIQFTYNLLRDNIPDLMEEIQNEFNFSHDNLNHIYETLKKISIYSKFYKQSDILHDNSV